MKAFLGFVFFGLSMFAGAGAFAAPGHAHEAVPNLDRRLERIRANKVFQAAAAPQTRIAAENALRARLPELQLERDEITRSPKSLMAGEGFLTGPNGQGRAMPEAGVARQAAAQPNPQQIIRNFVREHRDFFGHDAAALDAATVRRDHTAPHSGLRTISWEQKLAGIPVFGGRFKAHVTRNGELVSLGSGFVPGPETAAEAGQLQAASAQAPPAISALQALLAAAGDLELPLDGAPLQTIEAPSGAEQKNKLSGPGWEHPATLTLVWLPMAENSLRLCWQVWLTDPRNRAGYELLVDAATGEVWKRRCFTDHASPATYRVFTSESPTPLLPGYSTPTTNQPAVASRTLQTITSLSSTASPNGWIDDGLNELSGNNARAIYHRMTSENSAVGESVHGNPARVFDFPLNLSQDPHQSAEAATVNAFYWVNWAHDKFYALGFTETAGNCQQNNFGRGGADEDRMTVIVQDFGTEDNASMTPWPEGSSPSMALGIYYGPSPDRDAALDATLILHEYTHAVSTRLHENNLDELQSQGMGEGWSDFFALALLSQSGDSLNANYPGASYTALKMWGSSFDENYYFGHRRYPYSTDLTKNPLTFKDIDPEQASSHPGVPAHPTLGGFPASEVHMQGEVWCSMLWEARAMLITKHGFAAGNQLIMQLVLDGMELNPSNPSFIQARNSILAADQAMTGGANKAELRAAFAKRGMGVHAFGPFSPTTGGIVESYDSLDDLLVSPGTGLTINGPVGGPFSPISRTFNLTNDGNAVLTWRLHVDPPLEASVSAGTLFPGASQSVKVELNLGAAGSLLEGVYFREVRFTNRTSGVVVERNFTVLVGLQNPPMEYFNNSGDDTNDLAFTQLVFSPTDGGAHYTVCEDSRPNAFPNSTASAQTISFEESTFIVVPLAGGAKFPFYGVNYSSLAVGINGSVIFGGRHTHELATVAAPVGHFAVPRVSPMAASYSPDDSSRASWKQLADRMVISWEDWRVSGYSTRNNFQLELFFNGEIRMTLLDLINKSGSCGVSPGNGAPLLFVESNLSASPSCDPSGFLLKLPGSVTEGSLTTAKGILSIPGRGSLAALAVSLSSSDTSEVTVPSSVIIPAGRSSVEFDINVVNDGLLDGTQVIYITASQHGFKSAVGVLRVHDNENATLSVGTGNSPFEGGFTWPRTVTISAPVQDMVTVHLTSSRPEEVLPEPPAAIIPAGQTSATFRVRAVDDNRIDGTQTAIITASVQNWVSGTRAVNAIDNESTNLTLKTSFLVSESMGTITNGGTVELDGTLTTNLLVAVISDDESEVRTPLFGVLIPAGSTNAQFPLFIQDDAVIDGVIITRLRAIAGGFGSATNYVWVIDNDGPPEPFNPYPPHESVNLPLQTDLSWGRVEGELVLNGSFETGDLTSWTSEGPGSGSWVINDGTFNPVSADGPLPPFAGSFSALAQQLGNGTHALYQDIVIPAGATSATLSWSDRIRNHAGQFTAGQQFRVELRNPENDHLLTTLFVTGTNHPAITEWSNRTVNLGPYRGQTVRLAFVEEDSLGFLNVHVDNVSLVAPGASTTSFDLYFGTNPTPGAEEFFGTTTNTSWVLPMLAGGTDYYWQLKARRGTSTNAGPIWTFRTVGQSTNVALIAFDSSWRYRNNGANLGTAWTNLNYSETGWLTGTGTMGFGGGQDTTIGSAANGYVTYYFRKKFTLSDTSRLVSAQIGLVRDDGAVVFVNGRRVILSNMPRTAIGFDTEAETETTGFEQFLPFFYDLSSTTLVEGTNIVAVEVHQLHPGRGVFSPDLYFNLELTVVTNVGNLAPGVTLTAPADFAQVTAPTNVILQASVLDEFASTAGVDFYANGVKLGADIFGPYSFNWINPAPGAYVLTAVTVDGGGLSATSAPVHLIVAPASGQLLLTLVPPGSDWSYSNVGEEPGRDWRSRTYNDRLWSHGPAQLGYGDGDEATIIGGFGFRVDKPTTAYFRHTFPGGANLSGFQMRVLRDDGVAVFLNGTEIFRNNLPAGELDYDTLATSTVTGAAENTWLVPTLSSNVIAPLLQAGNNVIAAEVHQSAVNSPDLSFDLEFLAIGNALPTVSITSPANGTALLSPPSVQLAATAIDAYGAVTSVQFLRNGTPLGSDAASPYQFTWNNPPVGVYTLTAVATDNSGAIQTSAPVTLTIVPLATLSIRTLATNAVELTWPLSAPGYHVETTPSLLEPIVWVPLNLPVTQVNGQFRVLVNPDEAERYFRLRAP